MINVEVSTTEYFAKRKLIRAAIEFFLKNRHHDKIRIVSAWDNEQGDHGIFDFYVSKKRLIRLTFNFIKKKPYQIT